MSRKRLFIPTVGLLAGMLLWGGCYKPVEGPVVLAWPAEGETPGRTMVGKSVEGRDIECLVMGQTLPATLILAAIHGDEPAGVAIVQELSWYFQKQRQLLRQRKVILLAIANPDGLAHNRRYNARGIDLNRNFAASNRSDNVMGGPQPFSEPESRVIAQLIAQYGVSRIVSIHQLTDMGPGGLVHRVPNGCIDYDGDGKAIAEHMAKFCDLPVKKLGASPGSLGAYAEQTLGIVCITVELPPEAEMLGSGKLWERYGKALAAAVAYPDDVK